MTVNCGWPGFSLFFNAEAGSSTYSTKLMTPLPSTCLGGQKAFFSFLRTTSGVSSRSIFESGSDELILPPSCRPGISGFIRCARLR